MYLLVSVNVPAEFLQFEKVIYNKCYDCHFEEYGDMNLGFIFWYLYKLLYNVFMS